MELDTKQNRYVGCLVGGAAADALGYAVEFLQDFGIFRKYGENGITEYDLSDDGKAWISDDTQMTLFTAEGLILSENESDAVDSLYKSYLNWYKTQTHDVPLASEGLMSISKMYNRRAPGHTCLNALESGTCGTMEYRINRSKGCGGVMRVAPVALYSYSMGLSVEDADVLAARSAAITHGHDLGFIPAAMLVHIIYRILEGAELSYAVRDAISFVPALFPDSDYVLPAVKLMERAIELSGEDMDDLDAIRELGEGWVAEETLAIAVYSCLKYRDSFEKVLISSVNHSGDSDSTGAVAGNIIGAYLGIGKIPKKFIDNLELSETCAYMALKLCEKKINDN